MNTVPGPDPSPGAHSHAHIASAADGQSVVQQAATVADELLAVPR